MKLHIAIVLFLVFVVLVVVVNSCIGIGGWGPKNTYEVTVTKCWVDVSTDSDGDKQSHYMVGTDKGVFEVDNGILLGVWKADKLYGKLTVGKKYRITTKGREIANIFFQEYPYIIEVQELTTTSPDLPEKQN